MKELQTETNLTAAFDEASLEKSGNGASSGETISCEPADELTTAEEIKGTAVSRRGTIYGAELEEELYIDTEEACDEDEETWDDIAEAESEEQEQMLVYDVPRPALTINEAASILGKSVRAVERGISGKWGNRLPEGWKARKMRIDGQDEWRIIPPPSFRIRHSNKVRTPGTSVMTTQTTEKSAPSKPASASEKEEDLNLREVAESLLGFSFNGLIQSAGKKAKTELVRAAEYALDNNMDHPTIVIDRSDEVERLLRELSDVRKELADERKMHLEDLRMLADMQSSMRLLEMKSSQTSTLKEELAMAATALKEHKRQYQEFLELPWWKRLFKRTP